MSWGGTEERKEGFQMMRGVRFECVVVAVVSWMPLLLGGASPYQRGKDATTLQVSRTGADEYTVVLVGEEVGHVDLVAVPATSQEHHKIKINVRTKDVAGDRGYDLQAMFSNPKSVRVEGVVIRVLDLSGQSFKDASQGCWELKKGEDVVPGGSSLNRSLELKGVITWEANGSFYFQEGVPSERLWRRVRAPKVAK